MLLFLPLFINWNPNPTFHLLGISFHWYGILFGLNFIQGYLLLAYFLKKENKPSSWADYALLAMIIGTILGARLGHVFFYKWDYYKQHIIEIFMIWKGGLASHGSVIGIVTALWAYSRVVTKKPLIYILDRLMIPIAIGCFLVRTGNLINQEIIGLPTNVPWAFIFHKIDALPRHPSQIYEGISYFSIALIMFLIYRKKRDFGKPGYFTGIFFTLAFLSRFLVEFTKENQVAFESRMQLNMGQWLSIPFFLFGVILLINIIANKTNRSESS